MFILDLYDAMRDEYRRWRDGPSVPSTISVDSVPPAPAPTAEPPPPSDLPAVKNWSHPFGDTSSVFQQLATLAKAQSGYFPLGRNGLWHGGVHFDSGTAGPQGQSFVRCLADGEVIAYRIPEQTPKTRFFPAPGVTIEAPFATGFVLVRHRLEAPKIEGVADAPPSLIFYSLYMHLADWASYLADPDKPRPAFWPESDQYRVKTDTDPSPVRAGEKGLNLRHAPTQGKTIGFLPQGAVITVSGEGAYRKVEGIKGPVKLQNPDGTLQGYVGFSALLDLGGGAYRVNTTRDALRVRPTPDTSRSKIFELPRGTESPSVEKATSANWKASSSTCNLLRWRVSACPNMGKSWCWTGPARSRPATLSGTSAPTRRATRRPLKSDCTWKSSPAKTWRPSSLGAANGQIKCPQQPEHG
ncbi:hypothetical protein [Pseudomonas sp. USHLN015]|uniref:hypothetical protein n=1 Tax=Pseudomonas sp. USHLN015 TaxID=3081296 RepID=UPI00301CDFD0